MPPPWRTKLSCPLPNPEVFQGFLRLLVVERRGESRRRQIHLTSNAVLFTLPQAVGIDEAWCFFDVPHMVIVSRRRVHIEHVELFHSTMDPIVYPQPVANHRIRGSFSCDDVAITRHANAVCKTHMYLLLSWLFKWAYNPKNKYFSCFGCCCFGSRYQSASAIVTTAVSGNSTLEGGTMFLFGGKDDWRRFNDVWLLRLNSVYVYTSLVPFPHESIRPANEVSHSTWRPDSAGSWARAQAGRDERCQNVVVTGTANDTWHGSCGGVDDGGDGGDGSCTMHAVLEMAWCLGEYQGVGFFSN